MLQRVSPRSAARMGFLLAATLSAIVLVGLFALYLLGLVSGGLDSVDAFIVSFGGSTGGLSFFKLLPGFLAMTAIWCGIWAATAGVLAVLYNLLADLSGGVEISVRER